MEQIPQYTSNNMLEAVRSKLRNYVYKDFEKGVDVVVFQKYNEYSVGRPSERVGHVTAVHTQTIDVSFGPKVIRVLLSELAPFNDFSNALLDVEASGIFNKPSPKFNIDQIVFFKPNNKQPSHSNPVINSEFETDCKIIKILNSEFGFNFLYSVYSPGFGSIQATEDDLVLAKDKIRYVYRDYADAIVPFDARPFFNENEKVCIYGGSVHNQDDSVMVPLTDELQKKLIII